MRAHEITDWRERFTGPDLDTTEITAACSCRRWQIIETDDLEVRARGRVTMAYVQHTVDEAIMDGAIPIRTRAPSARRSGRRGTPSNASAATASSPPWR